LQSLRLCPSPTPSGLGSPARFLTSDAPRRLTSFGPPYFVRRAGARRSAARRRVGVRAVAVGRRRRARRVVGRNHRAGALGRRVDVEVIQSGARAVIAPHSSHGHLVGSWVETTISNRRLNFTIPLSCRQVFYIVKYENRKNMA